MWSAGWEVAGVIRRRARKAVLSPVVPPQRTWKKSLAAYHSEKIDGSFRLREYVLEPSQRRGGPINGVEPLFGVEPVFVSDCS